MRFAYCRNSFVGRIRCFGFDSSYRSRQRVPAARRENVRRSVKGTELTQLHFFPAGSGGQFHPCACRDEQSNQGAVQKIALVMSAFGQEALHERGTHSLACDVLGDGSRRIRRERIDVLSIPELNGGISIEQPAPVRVSVLMLSPIITDTIL
jgi:hypothetical protein